MNFTSRSLAAVLKYDNPIPVTGANRSTSGIAKGYYDDDRKLVRRIKQNVVGTDNIDDFKTIECWIMDLADDIAYSTYDLEDNFKGEFLTPLKLFSLPDPVLDSVAADITKRARKSYVDIVGSDYTFDPIDTYEILKELFASMFAIDEDEEEIFRKRHIPNPEKKMLLSFSMEQWSDKLVQNGYYRTSFTSGLVQRFIQGIEVVPNSQYQQLHQVRLRFPTFLEVEVLKNITYHAVIRSPRVQVVEFRGKDIVKKIFEALSGPNGLRLLPDDFQIVCDGATRAQQLRAITDFIAGMTDRYAIEFYVRLFGAEGLTIHKPL